MKQLLFVCLFFLIGSPLFSQIDEEINLIQQLFQIEKSVMIARYLDVSNEVYDQFIPIYEACERDRMGIARQRINLLKKYAAQYENLTDDQAASLASEFFSFSKKTMKLRKKYYKNMKKKKFVQIVYLG